MLDRVFRFDILGDEGEFDGMFHTAQEAYDKYKETYPDGDCVVFLVGTGPRWMDLEDFREVEFIFFKGEREKIKLYSESSNPASFRVFWRLIDRKLGEWYGESEDVEENKLDEQEI